MHYTGGANSGLTGSLRLGDNTAPSASTFDIAGKLIASYSTGLITKYNNASTAEILCTCIALDLTR